MCGFGFWELGWMMVENFSIDATDVCTRVTDDEAIIIISVLYYT